MTARRKIFVTGMFRSGTTLVARMLATHPALAFASDPYAPMFKALRNAVAERQTDAVFDNDAPLDDYYFDPDKTALLDATRSVDLSTIAAPDDLGQLRDKLVRQCQAYSPHICPLLNQLEGSNFAELFESGFRIVAEAYGHDGEQSVGIKEVWAGEFVWPLLASFPDANAVVIVRDPRAVAASKNVHTEKYPWLFLTRQWRKLAALAWLAAHDDSLGGRIHLVRYEDLVERPEENIRALCRSSKLDYEERLINPAEYRDGDDAPWFQNSSHYAEVRAFNPASIGRWRDVLSSQETEFVEAVCWPEMRLFGYELERFDPNNPDEVTFDLPPVIARDELAAWIRPYAMDDIRLTREDMVHEHRRLQLLTDRALPEEDELRQNLLDVRLHQPLKDAIKNELH